MMNATKYNLPMLLTWLRVVLIPVFVLIFFVHSSSVLWQNYLATFVFILASVTDWFDGFLARRLNQTSDFGAFLDPVADKLMITAALILLVYLHRTSPIVAIIIVSREIAISALREWMAQVGKRKSVAVAYIGKIKTTVQMIAVVILLIYEIPYLHLRLHNIGNVFMWIACILTLWSMFHYISLAVKQLKESK